MTAYNIPTLEEIKQWIEPPDFLLNLVKEDDKKGEVYKLPEIIKDGERKKHLFKFASSLRAKGLETAEIEAALWSIVPRCENSEDVKKADLADILHSVSKYEKGSAVPIELPESLEPQPITESNSGGGDGGDTDGEDDTKPYVIALGHSGDKYYFTSSSNRQISVISASNFSLNAILNLQTYDYWQEKFPKDDKANTPIDIHQVTNFLMRKSREKGVFSVGNLRGRGVWSDKGRTILHCGESIYDLQSKRAYSLGRFETKYIYELGQSYEPTFQKDRDTQGLFRLISSLKWKSKNSPYILIGWIVVARFSGWLNWRPHIWITGQKGTGKTTVIRDIVKYLLGPQHYYFEGGSTAAGVRQEIKCDSLPIIFDEAETSDQKTGAKIKSILELARQASSDSDGYICKGTPTGSGLKYKMSSCFCLASIRVNLQEEQDKSRFAVLELDKCKEDNWPELSRLLQDIDMDYGESIFAEMSELTSELAYNIKYTGDKLAEMGLERRLADQYGTLFAGYLTFTHKKKVGEVEVAELLVKTNIDELLEAADSDYTDSDDCLSTILQCRTNFNEPKPMYSDAAMQMRLTISELVHKARTIEKNEAYCDELSRYGICVGSKHIFVASKNTELAKLMRETPWGNHMWKDSLMRLPGSKYDRKRIHGSQNRGVLAVFQSDEEKELSELPF